MGLKEELLQNDLDNANSKVSELSNRIIKAIELLSKGITFCENDSQGLYDKCNIAINREKKALEILKGSESNE